MNITLTEKDLGALLRRHRDWIIDDLKDYFGQDDMPDPPDKMKEYFIKYMDDWEAQIEGKESIELLGIKTIKLKGR